MPRARSWSSRPRECHLAGSSPGGWSFVRSLVIDRLTSFGLVVGVGFLMLTSLLVSAGLAALHTYLGETFPGGAVLLEAVNVIVSLAVISVLFAMVYKLLPDVELAWGDVWVGGLVTAGLWTVGKFLIGLYLGTSAFASSMARQARSSCADLGVLLGTDHFARAEFTGSTSGVRRKPPPSDFATRIRLPRLRPSRLSRTASQRGSGP